MDDLLELPTATHERIDSFMQVALAQLNPTIGAIRQNVSRILACAKDMQQKGAALLIAPELAICGYPPLDLLFRPDFIDEIEKGLAYLAQHTPIPVLLGAPIRRDGSVGFSLWNAAVLAQDGQYRVVAKKALLPNYQVFNERRYFEPRDPAEKTPLLEIGGERIGVVICEDAWNDADFWQKRRYAYDPVADVVSSGATVVVALSASPYSLGKPTVREAMLAHAAKKYALPMINVMQVGAEDQIIFDGATVAFAPSGKIAMRLPAFHEAVGVIDLAQVRAGEVLSIFEWPSDEAQWADALALGIRDYIEKSGAKGVMLGLSGGVDSAVVAALAVKALGPKRVLGVRLPSGFSSEHSLEDAEELARNLGIQLETIAIEPVVQSLRQALTPMAGQSGALPSIVDQNLQARARGVLLMGLSNQNGHLLLATGNKSELAVSYSTLYGDMCGALMPIGDLWKTQVWQLAKFLQKQGFGIPQRTIDKVPSAELAPGQTDQDTLPPYEELDVELESFVMSDGAASDQIKAMVCGSEYKRRQAPPILMLSERVFGVARLWPLVKSADLKGADFGKFAI